MNIFKSLNTGPSQLHRAHVNLHSTSRQEAGRRAAGSGRRGGAAAALGQNPAPQLGLQLLLCRKLLQASSSAFLQRLIGPARPTQAPSLTWLYPSAFSPLPDRLGRSQRVCRSELQPRQPWQAAQRPPPPPVTAGRRRRRRMHTPPLPSQSLLGPAAGPQLTVAEGNYKGPLKELYDQ